MRNIKRKILRMGYTLPEFSEKTGIYYGSLMRALSGKYNTSFETCLKIIYASGGTIELEDFLSEEKMIEHKAWQAKIDEGNFN